MKKYKLALVLTAVVILFSMLLVGCQSGIPQEQYDAVAAQLGAAQAQVNELQGKVGELQAQGKAADAGLKTAQAQVTALQNEIASLKKQYELVGATPADTAANIVRYYHETHVYTTYDLYVCSDMSSDVWNMLKAQGINAVVVVGNVDAVVNDILLSDHAWVLAEVAPGQYLALETTGGYVVPKSENALYYRGWYFDSPADLKANNDLVKEYNVRVGIHNQIVDKDREVIDEHNRATNQTTAEKLEAVHDKLVELIKEQQAEMNRIMTEINRLAIQL